MDVQLAYSEAGAGENLILLHGNGEDRTYFEHQIPAFSEHFHIYAVDTRGHGQSPRGGAPFTLEQFALDLRDFMDERHIDRAHMLGFSDGANIAMLFALRFPERVDRLILNGGNLHPWSVKLRYQLPIALGYALCALLARFDSRAIPHRELLGLMVAQPHIAPEQLGAIQAQTLVVAGTNDMIRYSETKRIASSLPHGALAILPGDHFLANRRPDAFNRATLAFLRKGRNDP